MKAILRSVSLEDHFDHLINIDDLFGNWKSDGKSYISITCWSNPKYSFPTKVLVESGFNESIVKLIETLKVDKLLLIFDHYEFVIQYLNVDDLGIDINEFPVVSSFRRALNYTMSEDKRYWKIGTMVGELMANHH